LLALEAVHHLLSTRTGPPGRAAPSSAPPKSLEEVTARRVQDLNEAERELLALVAVHPQLVPPSQLQVLGPGDVESREAAQMILEREGLLTARGGTDPGWRLAHPSLRQSYLRALPPELRREAHRRWLAALTPADPEAEVSGPQALLLYHHAV